jgi:hypothetical protein
MKTRSSHRWVRRAGFAVGLMAAAAVVVGARVPPQPRDLGLDLTIVPVPAKALTIRPGGPLLTAPGMRAGGAHADATGRLTVINPTAGTRRVRLHAMPSSHALDRALMVEVTIAGKPLYRGPLGGLRRATKASTDLASGDGRTLRVHAWLPPEASGWRGRIEDVNLAFDSAPVTAR